MPIVLSYLVIPLVFFLLAVNVYLRFKIIKRYKYLKDKDISIEPSKLMNKTIRKDYLKTLNPKDAEELDAFASSLRTLVMIVITGFLVILASFLYIYFSQGGN